MTHQSPAFFGHTVAVPEVGGSYGKFVAHDAASAPSPGTWLDLRPAGNNMPNTGVSLIGTPGSGTKDTFWWLDGSNSWFTTSGSTIYREWGRLGFEATVEIIAFADPSANGQLIALWDSLYSGTANSAIQNYHTAAAGGWGITMNAYPAEAGGSDNASTGNPFPYATQGAPKFSHILFTGAWGSAGNIDVYANGRRTATGARRGGWPSGTSPRNPRIGSSEFGGGNARRFIGGLGVVQVWAGRFTAAQAWQQMLSWNPIYRFLEAA